MPHVGVNTLLEQYWSNMFCLSNVLHKLVYDDKLIKTVLKSTVSNQKYWWHCLFSLMFNVIQATSVHCKQQLSRNSELKGVEDIGAVKSIKPMLLMRKFSTPVPHPLSTASQTCIQVYLNICCVFICIFLNITSQRENTLHSNSVLGNLLLWPILGHCTGYWLLPSLVTIKCLVDFSKSVTT